MPNCLQNLDAHGEYGSDIRSLGIPSPLVDICPGDFLTSTTVDSTLLAKLMSDLAWTTNLATTQAAAKLVFRGVSLGELDANVCDQAQQCVPYANYPYRTDGKFNRSYVIVNSAGAAAPTTWLRGQGFTFGKNPTANELDDHTIQKTDTANLIVFRAIEDSGPSLKDVARVQFAD